MTSYFDEAHKRLHEARKLAPDYRKMVDAFNAEEKRVVFDCTVAAMLPGFPLELKKAVHRVVLRMVKDFTRSQPWKRLGYTNQAAVRNDLEIIHAELTRLVPDEPPGTIGYYLIGELA